jgi:hypothetical protein
MGDQTLRIRNGHTTQDHLITGAEGMDIETVADTHK